MPFYNRGPFRRLHHIKLVRSPRPLAWYRSSVFFRIVPYKSSKLEALTLRYHRNRNQVLARYSLGRKCDKILIQGLVWDFLLIESNFLS